jgi:hypothetical protein
MCRIVSLAGLFVPFAYQREGMMGAVCTEVANCFQSCVLSSDELTPSCYELSWSSHDK